jgi:hypothetical protein
VVRVRVEESRGMEVEWKCDERRKDSAKELLNHGTDRRNVT